MATNKERIEGLERDLGSLQDTMQQMGIGMADKLQRIEEIMSRLPEMIQAGIAIAKGEKNESGPSRSTPNSIKSTDPGSGDNDRLRSVSKDNTDEDRPMFASKTAKLDFPRFSGGDPTEWLTKTKQFFEFQNIREDRKVPLASYHLDGEANNWWQWVKEAYQEEGIPIAWDTFQDELWTRFGPAEGDNADEELAKIKQEGSFREYQKEFERLGNKVRGWTQKALIGTFMGGLKSEISDHIRMFKPKSLREAIGLARMRDEQVRKQSRQSRSAHCSPTETTAPIQGVYSPIKQQVKQLTWEEMQRRRSQNLCFNCDERFTPGHRCKKPQLLLLEMADNGLTANEPDFESSNFRP